MINALCERPSGCGCHVTLMNSHDQSSRTVGHLPILGVHIDPQPNHFKLYQALSLGIPGELRPFLGLEELQRCKDDGDRQRAMCQEDALRAAKQHTWGPLGSCPWLKAITMSWEDIFLEKPQGNCEFSLSFGHPQCRFCTDSWLGTIE